MADLTFHNDLAGVNFTGTDRAMNRLDGVNPALKVFFTELLEVARKEWGDDAWRWFDEHKEDRIVTVKKWFLSFTFRVKHCGALLLVVAGPRPE